VDVLVFFSIDHGYPGGPARHMSISVPREARVPHPAVVWEVASHLGFAGPGIEACDMVWPDRGPPVNLIQFQTTADAAKGVPH
jgi:hypothetical protein